MQGLILCFVLFSYLNQSTSTAVKPFMRSYRFLHVTHLRPAFKKMLTLNSFLRCRETEHRCRRGRERGRHRIRSRLQALLCQDRDLSGSRTNDLQDYDLSPNWTLHAPLTEPPRCPFRFTFNLHFPKVCVNILMII